MIKKDRSLTPHSPMPAVLAAEESKRRVRERLEHAMEGADVTDMTAMKRALDRVLGCSR